MSEGEGEEGPPQPSKKKQRKSSATGGRSFLPDFDAPGPGTAGPTTAGFPRSPPPMPIPEPSEPEAFVPSLLPPSGPIYTGPGDTSLPGGNLGGFWGGETFGDPEVAQPGPGGYGGFPDGGQGQGGPEATSEDDAEGEEEGEWFHQG